MKVISDIALASCRNSLKTKAYGRIPFSVYFIERSDIFSDNNRDYSLWLISNFVLCSGELDCRSLSLCSFVIQSKDKPKMYGFIVNV